MKLCKRILPLLLLLTLLPLSVSAAGDIDGKRDTTLTVYALYDGTPITGMEMEVYRVASVDATGELTVLPTFADYREALDIRGENDTAWQQMAQTLERFLLREKIAPEETIPVNGKGIAAFGTMAQGLYLLRADAVTLDGKVYAIAPCFLLLPGKTQEDTWNYQVETWVKPSENPEFTQITVVKNWLDNCTPAHAHPEVTIKLWHDGEVVDTVTLPKDGKWRYTWNGMSTLGNWEITEEAVEGYTQQKPIAQEGYTFTITNVCKSYKKPGKLPQTGQLWWPVPVLLCCGLFCLVMGAIRRRKEEI